MKLMSVAVACGVACSLFLSMPAVSQTEAGNPVEKASPEAYRLEITRDKFDAFIGAAAKVARIRQQWQTKIEAAKDTVDAQILRESARQEMRQAIEGTPGISTKEYFAIIQVARQSPRFAQVIRNRVRAYEERADERQP